MFPAPAAADRRFLCVSGILVLVVAVLTAAGWITGQPQLTMWVPGRWWTVMNSSVGLFCCGLGLVLVAIGWYRAARIAGCLVLAIAILVLIQFFSGRSLGIDDLFWHHQVAVQSDIPPGRMPTNTAVALLLAGIALVAVASPRGHRVWLTFAGVGLLTLATLPLLSFIGSFSVAGVAYHGMALPTIVSLLLLAAAILRLAAQKPKGEELLFPPAMAAAVSLLISIGIVSALTNADLLQSQRRIVQSHMIQASIDQVVARVARMESTARLYAIGGQESARQSSITHERELVRLLGVLDGLVADDPTRRDDAKLLRRRALEKIDHNNAVLEARRTTGTLAGATPLILAQSGATNNAMIAVGNDMKADERRELADNEAETALLVRGTRATQIFGSLVAFYLVGLTITQTRRAATARRAAEQARDRIESARAELLSRFEKIGQQVPGMIYQFRMRPDGTACFPYCSNGIRDIFGLTPEEVRDDASKVIATIHPDDRERIVNSNRESLKTLQPWYREYRVLKADGSVRWTLGRAVPEREPDGSVMCYGFVTDITDRKKLEENLSQARDQALEASRLKSEFLATISHEIRTPMNSVIGMAELLASTPLSDDQKDMAKTIYGGAESLLVIINDILDFSKIEAGRMRIDTEEFDLRRLVEETLTLQAHRAHEKGLTLVGEFESLPSGSLLGDSGRVRQILTNLVGNAIKFTLAGKVEVRVRVLSETPERARLRVQVRDTGIGIPLKAQKNLFQPFTQADGSSTRRFGGTGLGLAISRQLVTLMGGTMGFESEPDRGSTFWFEIEFARHTTTSTWTPPLAPIINGPSHHLSPAPTNNGVKKRLLVAEDNPSNQKVITLLLRNMGYDITLAENGQSALAALSAEPFDAVLMDCQMPYLDGYETTRRIRSGELKGVDKQLPIIAVSAYARPEDRIRSLQAGMNDHVSKPIRQIELEAALLRAGLAAEPAPIEEVKFK